MKYCPKCKTRKPISDFCKSKNRKDGHNWQCKICASEYQRLNWDRIQPYQNKYRQDEVNRNKTNHRAAQRLKTPEGKLKHKARITVNHAVRDGKLPTVTSQLCGCGKQAQQYHHHKGYESEFWLDVVPVCRPCHINIDRR